jgi:hypothetical protein
MTFSTRLRLRVYHDGLSLPPGQSVNVVSDWTQQRCDEATVNVNVIVIVTVAAAEKGNRMRMQY